MQYVEELINKDVDIKIIKSIKNLWELIISNNIYNQPYYFLFRNRSELFKINEIIFLLAVIFKKNSTITILMLRKVLSNLFSFLEI